MRVFTADEKKILINIHELQGGNLYTLIGEWISGVTFEVNTVSNNVTLAFDSNILSQSGVTISQRIEQIQEILIQAVNLIKLFEDKGYLFSFQSSAQISNPFIFNQYLGSSSSHPYQFPDKRISELVAKYATQELFVTPELEKFILDGFITREEFRADRQFNVTSTALRTTKKALYISTTGVLLTLFFNIYNSCNRQPSKPQPIIEKRATLITIDTPKKNIIFDIAKPKVESIILKPEIKSDTTKKKKNGQKNKT